MEKKPTIVLFGTFDTKLQPLLLLHELIVSHTPSPAVMLMDVGRTPVARADIPHVSGASNSIAVDRSEAVTELAGHMAEHLRRLHAAGAIHGAISLGGSCGTALAATAMQRAALPIGFPKVIVSTMAGGDVSPYVGDSDIVLMPSIVDIAGSNTLLSRILANAAAAITGMAFAIATTAVAPSPPTKKAVAISMFGITTPAVTEAQRFLERHGLEVYVFHATGAGGSTMERLAAAGHFQGVLDLTTTELADELFGGVLSAGPDRLTVATRCGVPQVVSVGATDCINFGPLDTLPASLRAAGNGGRTIVVHNPSVTLMRTDRDECRVLGSHLAQKLRPAGARAAVVLPTQGVSALSAKGGAFCHPEADEALRDELKRGLDGSGVVVVEEDMAINDTGFGEKMATRLVSMMDTQPV